MQTQPTNTIYYFSGSHWDREWYLSFQGFRNRLVRMMNDLIEYLESHPEFQVFHLDGQTIVLEDYLAIEPEKRERLAKLISDGRIPIGPWYVMPDEMLLSGESLIRNLLEGDRICREWNVEPWKYGYLCDMFGHIAQMPQILNGFGIHHAVLGRGTNEHNVPAHFIWQSPDGSECIAFKLNDYGGYGYVGSQFDFKLEFEDISQLEEPIRQLVEYERGRTSLPVIAIFDANDHQPVRKQTVEFMEIIRKYNPDAEVKHSNLLEMGRQLEKFRSQMPAFRGEIYETARSRTIYNHVIRHTLSSRYPLKQNNDQIQTLLEKWVEPLAVIGDAEDCPIQQTYIDLAYQHLLSNHAHDSICGCSIDQVHKDMDYRFDQARMLAANVISDVMLFLQEKAYPYDQQQVENPCRVVTIRNPMPYCRKETVTVPVYFPLHYPHRYAEPFGYEDINSFRLQDYEGNEIPYVICGVRSQYFHKNLTSSTPRKTDQYRISFEASLPAMGVSEYKIIPSQTPSRWLKRLSQSDREAENEWIRLTIHDNGTLRLYDKRSGQTYDQLASYRDDGEIGDGWYHVNPVEDRMVSSMGSNCIIERVENGPSRTVFRITQSMKIPEGMEWTRTGIRRSPQMAEMNIVSLVGLSIGAAGVDIETKITNRSGDHRVRLFLPTGIGARHYFVNQAFCFIERQTGIDYATQDWKEYDVPEKQTGGIVGKRSDEGYGLALVSAYGLHECAGLDDERQSLAVTLFRSFNKTVFTNGEEGGQVLGDLNFRYLLMPLQRDTTYADLTRLQDGLQAGFETETIVVPEDYVLPLPSNFMEISESDICLSVMKRTRDQAEGEFIVRLNNMSNRISTAVVTFGKELQSVAEVDLLERNPKEISMGDRSFKVTLRPWKIQNYRIKWKGIKT